MARTAQALVTTTVASEADSSAFPKVTGLAVTATEPEGTQVKILTRTNGTWQKYSATKSAWEDAETQELTPASVLAEGNTPTELNALEEAAFSAFTGKKFNFAVGLETTNDTQPAIDSIAVKGETTAQQTEKTVFADTLTLNDEGAVEILEITPVTETSNGGKVQILASILDSTGNWTEYADYTSYVTSPATTAQAIRFKYVLTAPTIGTSTASVTSISVKHRTDSVAVFSEGTGVCITKTRNFVSDINRAHLIVKHPVVPDTEFTAEVSLRPATKTVTGEVLGTGTGAAQTFTLQNTENLASHGFALYFDGEKQESGTYSFSPSDGQATCTAEEGVSITADYIYGWTTETFQPMTHDAQYPDRDDNSLVFDQFDYIYAKEGDQKGSIGCARVNLIQKTGTVKSEALGTATGTLQSVKLAHHAKPETISVAADGEELEKSAWKFKDNTDILQVTAKKGATLAASYRWAARPVYIEDLTCFFNE